MTVAAVALGIQTKILSFKLPKYGGIVDLIDVGEEP